MRRRLLIGFGAGAVVVVALFFVFLLKPKLSQISDVRKQVSEAQSQEQSLRNQIAALKLAKSQANTVTSKLLRLQEMLPTDAQLPVFIRLLQTAASAAGIDLQSIAPSAPAILSGTTGIQTISVNVTFQGGYFRIQDFLSRLEALRRVVLVKSLSLAPLRDPVTGLLIENATATLEMYVVQPNASLRPPATATPRPQSTSGSAT